MRKGLQGELSMSTDMRLEDVNPYQGEGGNIGAALDYAYKELAPPEQAVFELTFGYGGQPQLDTNKEIAKNHHWINVKLP